MIVDVQELRDYMSGVDFSAEQERAAKQVLAGIQAQIEDYLNRRIEIREFTTTAVPDADGFIRLETPVVEVISVTGADAAVIAAPQWSLTTAGGISLWPYAWTAGAISVRYRAGLDGKNDEGLRLAVLRAAQREMQQNHSDVLTSKGLSTTDERAAPEFHGLTEEELLGISRRRRRTVV